MLKAKEYTINGETMTLRQFQDKYKIDANVLRKRINNGWEEEFLLEKTGKRGRRKFKTVKMQNPPYYWSKASIECYEIGCRCSQCYIADDLKAKCKMKQTVLNLVKLYGAPEERIV